MKDKVIICDASHCFIINIKVAWHMDDDRRILIKYRKGRKVDPTDMDAIKRLSSVGLIRCGFDTENIMPTAITTELGKVHRFTFW